MQLHSKISDAEWMVMRVLWSEGRPLTSHDIIQALSTRESWAPNTVRTLLSRLVAKKAIGFQKNGKSYLYHSRIEEKDCVREASQSFLERVFGGALEPMLAHFVREKKLTPAQIAKLKRLLDDE